jgi:hypothetical protein
MASLMRWPFCLILLIAVVSAVGCGRHLCKVTGAVSINGKQAPAGLKITFTPQDADAEPILAVTENDGSYVLIDRSGRLGAPSGDYSVSVGFWGDESMNPPGLKGLKISEGYRDGSSTLTCSVRPGMGPFNIDMSRP